MRLVVALDCGTTGNRAIAFSQGGKIVFQAYEAFPQYFPKEAWVEHNPEEIWNSTLNVLKKVLSNCKNHIIDSIGITNQRETIVLWDKDSGKPVHNAIVWQCRRTAGRCQELRSHETMVREKTGLWLDPYFSATKIQWILENNEAAQKSAENNRLKCGTIDSWVLWKLTNGKAHKTDPSNASRTMLYNIHTHRYDNDLLTLFSIPQNILPEIQETSSLFGHTDERIVGDTIPITGMIGDQQAALFAQGGWEKGVVKNTYGTGLFLMSCTHENIPQVGKLINTVAWEIKGKLRYAIEGSVFVGGSAIQWLRDGLEIIKSANETEKIARSLQSNEGVYFVPALVGLGAPYWEPNARGLFTGLTRDTRRAHMIRATLESIAYQSKDLIDEINTALDTKTDILRVDGGAVANNFLMQFQADILGCRVERPTVFETTALGAAGVAGLETGFFSLDTFLKARDIDRVFEGTMGADSISKQYQGWKAAIKRCLS